MSNNIKIDNFQDIFTKANHGQYYDYASKQLHKVSWLERIVRILFACCMESTTAKCIRLSTQTLVTAIRNFQDPLISASMRKTIDELENSANQSATQLAEMINHLAPKLILECCEATKVMKQSPAAITRGQELASVLTEAKKYIDDTYPEAKTKTIRSFSIINGSVEKPIRSTLWPIVKQWIKNNFNGIPAQSTATASAKEIVEEFLKNTNRGAEISCTLKQISGQLDIVKCYENELAVHLIKRASDTLTIPFKKIKMIWLGKLLKNGDEIPTGSSRQPIFHLIIRP